MEEERERERKVRKMIERERRSVQTEVRCTQQPAGRSHAAQKCAVRTVLASSSGYLSVKSRFIPIATGWLRCSPRTIRPTNTLVYMILTSTTRFKYFRYNNHMTRTQTMLGNNVKTWPFTFDLVSFSGVQLIVFKLWWRKRKNNKRTRNNNTTGGVKPISAQETNSV